VRSLRHTTAAVAALAAVALAAAGCTGGSSGGTAAPIPSAAPSKVTGTVQFWHFFTGREAKAIQASVDAFTAANPGVKVVVKSGQDDDKMRQAIAAGQPIDVGLSYSTDVVGNFCSSGAFVDLKPYIDRDQVDLTQLPQVVRDYTEFKGTRCAMPMLADVYGLYYNKKLLAAAGYTEPPKTASELTEMAKKLTVRNADGSIKVAGFIPMAGFYENAAAHYAPSWGATWFKADGTSNIGSDPAWAAWLTWQKDLVDWYGYDNLRKFTAGLGQEFSADNAFETGKVAMNLDGEYRQAFVQAEAPNLEFGTAPFPTADDKTALAGAGYITGNIIGVAKGSENKEAAWALVKYLTTDTATVVSLANGIKNVPSTLPALQSPDLVKDEISQTFLDIFSNPNSATTPASPNGGAYQNSFGTFIEKWQAGKVSDLQAGLNQVDKEINDGLALNQAP
jgi:multiple sugar transport system substrate-binding protein